MRAEFAGAAFALLLAMAAPAGADTLIDNVNGLTFDAEGRVESFTGVLVGDDGRVEQVLRRGDKRPGYVDYRMDGKGRVLLPGLIDSHLPLMKFGLALLTETEALPEAQPRPEDRDLALAKAQYALLAQGITTVADMGTTIEDWQAYRRAGDAGQLRLRIAGYADGADAMILIGGPGPTPWLYEDRLRLVGVRLVLDGGLDRREALLKAPYADGPAKGAVPRLSETQLKNLMSRAAMDDFQVAVQASGDKAVADTLAAIEDLSITYKGERRWRIERATVVDPADFARFGATGTIASMQPRAAIDGAGAAARLGPARLAGVEAWASLAAGGARLVFGSDARLAPLRPFAAMAGAITRQGADGQPLEGWQPQERLRREPALAAWTVEGARALFAEGRIGRIARGMHGDFVLVDRDPLLASTDELRATRVVQTWIGGKLAWQAEEESAARNQAEGR